MKLIRISHKSLLLGLLLLALLGIALPWAATSSAALQPNAYDLAEWLTLLPAIRNNTPLMLPVLLIRTALLFVGILLLLLRSTLPQRTGQLIVWGCVFGIFVALIPSIDFFRGQYTDPNYAQQFYLWFAFTIAVTAIVALGNHRWLHNQILWGLMAIGGSIAALSGYVWGMQVLGLYEVGFRVGVGIVIYCVALITFGAILLFSLVGSK